MMHQLMILMILSFSSAFSAPLPLTGSSAYLNPKKNYFLHPFKIRLDLENTPYSLSLSKNNDENWTVIRDDKSFLITLRLKQFKNDESYEKSLKSWIREYQRAGFQLLNQQMGERRPGQGWIHLKDSKDQFLLQYFRYHNKLMVYFNCVGKKEDLAELQRSCRELNSRLSFITL